MPGDRFRDPTQRRDRFGRLLGLLVLVFIVSGFGTGPVARTLSGAIYVAAVGVAVGATGLPARLPQVPVAIVLIGLTVTSLILGQQDSERLKAIGSICTAVVIAGILFAVLARVLGHDDVQFQTIAGALCAYLLFGFLFAAVFSAIDILGPNHFLNQPEGQADYMYFSFVTLTTVGFGDIVAVSTLARRLVILEAITGQIFLATTVARLVSVARLGKASAVTDDELPAEAT